MGWFLYDNGLRHERVKLSQLNYFTGTFVMTLVVHATLQKTRASPPVFI